MSPKVRTSIYGALVLINVVLGVCAQQDAVPAAYAHWVALASFVCAALMKEVSAKDPPADAPKDPQ